MIVHSFNDDVLFSFLQKLLNAEMLSQHDLFKLLCVLKLMHFSCTSWNLRDKGESFFVFLATFVKFDVLSKLFQIFFLMLQTIKQLWNEKILLTIWAICIIRKCCNLPIHFFPGNSVLFFNEIYKVFDVKIRIGFMLGNVLPFLINNKIRIFITLNKRMNFKCKNLFTKDANLKFLIFVIEK